MGLVHSEAFVGTRCRLYRRRDARIVNAWVQYFRGASIVVTTEDEFEAEKGEQYYVEAFGPEVKACLDAKLVKFAPVDVDGDYPRRTAVTFRVEGQIQVSDSEEPSRHLVEGMTVELTFGTKVYRAEVRDVSTDGIGIISEEPWEPGLPLELTINSPIGPLQASGEVRYVKPHGNDKRIGIKFLHLSRLDRSRWRRLLGQPA